MRKIVTTADGTTSIHITETEEQYHSNHGAILEANHVFIQSGLQYLISKTSKPISIFEMGFGTGLNCLLTCLASVKENISIHYTGIESSPVNLAEIEQLNFHTQLGIQKEEFLKLHQLEWEKKHQINDQFSFFKTREMLQNYSAKEKFDVIYYDAFGSQTQPELWTRAITDKLFDMVQPNGVVVTYSAKGSFRRDLAASGFFVERITGPPGKRHMIRAVKQTC